MSVPSLGIVPRNGVRLAAYQERHEGFTIDASAFHYSVERLRLEGDKHIVVSRDVSADHWTGERAVRELVEMTGTPRLPDHYYEEREFPEIGRPEAPAIVTRRVEIVSNDSHPGEYLIGVAHAGGRWVLCGSVVGLGAAMDLAISRSEALDGIGIWDFSWIPDAPEGGAA